jgi:hypothetical protein
MLADVDGEVEVVMWRLCTQGAKQSTGGEGELTGLDEDLHVCYGL